MACYTKIPCLKKQTGYFLRKSVIRPASGQPVFSQYQVFRLTAVVVISLATVNALEFREYAR